jgi:hypothetical protein
MAVDRSTGGQGSVVGAVTKKSYGKYLKPEAIFRSYRCQKYSFNANWIWRGWLPAAVLVMVPSPQAPPH